MRNRPGGSNNGSGEPIDGTASDGTGSVDGGTEPTDNTTDNVESGTSAELDPTIGVKRRRRKPGIAGDAEGSEPSGNGSGAGQGKKLDLKAEGKKALAMQIVGAHQILGLLTGMPGFWDIQPAQGEALVNAVTDVCAQYKIKPSPKVAAWLNLAGVCGMVYVPKIIMLREARKLQARQQRPMSVPAAATDSTAPQAPSSGVMKFG